MVEDPKRPDAPEKHRSKPGGKLGQVHADFEFTTKDFRFTEQKEGSVDAWCMTVPMPEEMIRIKIWEAVQDWLTEKSKN